jgi:hypothetical protein
MDPIRRYLDPKAARVVIALIVAAQIAAVLGFSMSYARQARRIAELEDEVCRERLARFPNLVADAPCRNAQNVLAQVLPQRWQPLAEPASAGQRFGARVVGWQAVSGEAGGALRVRAR